VLQLCSKDYTKVNYFVEVKWIQHKTWYRHFIKNGELKGGHNYACEVIWNLYLEEKNKIKIIVYTHLHGIGKKMMYTEVCQNLCNAGVGITTRTEKHQYKLLTMKLLNQVLQSSLRQLYGCHNGLVYRYEISVSQMTTAMFNLSRTLSGPFLIRDLSLGV
jgi:hypothetical protein